MNKINYENKKIDIYVETYISKKEDKYKYDQQRHSCFNKTRRAELSYLDDFNIEIDGIRKHYKDELSVVVRCDIKHDISQSPDFFQDYYLKISTLNLDIDDFSELSKCRDFVEFCNNLEDYITVKNYHINVDYEYSDFIDDTSDEVAEVLREKEFNYIIDNIRAEYFKFGFTKHELHALYYTAKDIPAKLYQKVSFLLLKTNINNNLYNLIIDNLDFNKIVDFYDINDIKELDL